MKLHCLYCSLHQSPRVNSEIMGSEIILECSPSVCISAYVVASSSCTLNSFHNSFPEETKGSQRKCSKYYIFIFTYVVASLFPLVSWLQFLHILCQNKKWVCALSKFPVECAFTSWNHHAHLVLSTVSAYERPRIGTEAVLHARDLCIIGDVRKLI